MNLLENCYISFVNLDHRKDRLDKMVQTLGALNIKAERTRGMLPTEYPGDPSRVRVMQNRTPGAIGCHFSQVKIMQEALNRGQHAFVMEDDLMICSDFHDRMKIVEVFFDENEWDILWLGGTFHVNPPWWHKDDIGRDIELTDNPRIVRCYGAFSTHAYIVNANSLVKILKGLDDIVHLSMGIDWAMIQMEPNLLTYAFVPGMIRQYDNQSDIGKGVTRFSGFAKLGPYWYQDKMEDFDPSTFNWHEACIPRNR